MKSSIKKFYLGVEGGATKSTAILVDENDKILAKHVGKSINYLAIGERKVKTNLKDLLRPILKKAEDNGLYAVFGLAGLNTPKDDVIYKKLVKSVMPHQAIFDVLNDAEIALEARCPDAKNRILVIAGTGASVYGKNRKTDAKTTGWDFILGEEGSGYELGLKTMKAAVQSWDGRGPKTILQRLVLKKTGSKSMQDFMPAFYATLNKDMKNMKYFIASFAPLMDEAIQQNDAVALNIRKEATGELVRGVVAVAGRLNFKKECFCLGRIGSIWKMPGFKDQFQKEIKRQFPKVCFSENTDSGAWGAIILAKKLK